MQTGDKLLPGDIVRVRRMKGRWRVIGFSGGLGGGFTLEPANPEALEMLMQKRGTRGNFSIKDKLWHQVPLQDCSLHVVQCFRDGRALKKQREAERRVRPS